MNDEITQVIEEKFTRCPECRSFSVRVVSTLTFKEKIKSHFVPVTVQICGNCSHRFVSEGNLREGLKKQFLSLTGTFPGKWFAAAIPLVLAVVLVIILLMSGGKKEEAIAAREKEPVQTIETKPVPEEETQQKTGTPTGEVTPAEETNTTPAGSEEPQLSPEETIPLNREQAQPPAEEPEATPTPTFAGEIALDRNRFGVNWRPLGDGVQITRLSNGPVKDAGLLVGDIILEVDDIPVKGEGTGIEIARDEVFQEKRPQAIIKVQRNNEILLFKMIKSKKPGARR